MCSTSSAESEDLASDLKEPECEPLPSAKSIPSVNESSPSIGQMSLFGETSKPSKRRLFPTPNTMDHLPSSNLADRRAKGGCFNLKDIELMSFVAGSPAKTSASQERVQELKALARDYGASTPELLAKYDPATSSWRTSQLCLDGGLTEFSETWPRSGLMRNGIAYQLPPLVRLTDETGSGSWPTPVSRMWKDCGSPAEYRRNEVPLAAQVGGSLNPTWVEWLMGFPLGWTDCGASATQSSHKSQKSSDGQ
jgi:hypothetical protein